jgi:hypothetical protein
MRFSRFFITRPIFAAVIAVIITLIGGIAYLGLPVAQYPDIVPPTVTVNAAYPGASAETVAETVAAPIEQEVNGVDNMLYISSQSTGDGNLTITVTFKPGTDVDDAQVLVQNRVAIALPRLPQEVQRLGVVTRKTSPDFLLIVNLISPDGSLSRDYISNYALTQVRDRLGRLDGVGDVRLFGARDYAMRVWIDPGRAAALNLTAGEIVAALRSQNVQVAAGTLGQPPYSTGNAFQLNVQTQGRLTSPDQFANVIVRTDPDGRQVRVSDVGRVELGAADYSSNTYLSNDPTVIVATFQRPGSNALAAAEAVETEMKTLAKSFPPGLEYRVIYNPTKFIAQSMEAVMTTLIEAIVLVVLVIIVFLQKWRAAIIPVVAIPVSLIGTFAVLALVGYSLNNLSLFGLVLAIGIVVDDAIVVVENVERNLERGLSALEAARTSMDEVSAALVAIVLVLCAVFLPTLFMTGLSGAFYPSVRGDDLDGDGHLADRLSDPVARAGSDAAPATSGCGQAEPPRPPALRRGRPVQSRLRADERFLWPPDPCAGAPSQANAGRLRGADQRHGGAALGDADRLHPGTGPGLLPDRHPAAARLLARPHGCRAAQGGRAHPADRGRGGLGHAGRLRRRLADARAQFRRRLRSAQVVRGTREARRHLPGHHGPGARPHRRHQRRPACWSSRRRSSRASARRAATA